MLWLAVHLPDLGLELFRGQFRDPQSPHVLTEDNRVVLCNEHAAETGIAVGSTLATAFSIASSLEHHVRDAEREARRLELLAQTLYRFSSEVSPQAPDCVLLEVSGSLNLFGSLQTLEQQVQQTLAELGHRAWLRTGRTPLAALALARAKPLGIERLDAVPLTCCELEPKLIERFANIGVRSLGPLFRLPTDELAQRFGPVLTDYLQRLRGDAPDPRKCLTPSPEFDESIHLLEPLPDKQALVEPMQRLLVDLQHWLIAHQLGAARLTWHFTGQKQVSGNDRQQVALPVRFAEPRQDHTGFLEISRMRLDGAGLPEDVLSIRLQAGRLRPWQGNSRQLFEPLSRQAAGSLKPSSGLIDQLNARLGVNACTAIQQTDQHGPEYAWQYAAPAAVLALTRKSQGKIDQARVGHAQGDQTQGNQTQDDQAQADQPHQTAPQDSNRPLWLFPAPYRVARQSLTLLRGPERIQTGWWLEEGQALCRDYYVARHANGARCWAFLDVDQQWYLHGYFG